MDDPVRQFLSILFWVSSISTVCLVSGLLPLLYTLYLLAQRNGPVQFNWASGFTRNMPTHGKIAYVLGIVVINCGILASIAVTGFLWIILQNKR